ncbi:MAG TPA: hypothetical protein VHB51_00375 [Candidatus Saccharimonadales bacterium]|nr:hypothetical protein [Candidatus Saccharimonadales bacterium]
MACGNVFTTVEAADFAGVWAVRDKKDHLEPFSRDKLFLSLHRSLEHRKTALSDAGGLCDTLIGRLRPAVEAGVLETRAIRQHVLVALQRFDKVAAVHFAAFHSDN